MQPSDGREYERTLSWTGHDLWDPYQKLSVPPSKPDPIPANFKLNINRASLTQSEKDQRKQQQMISQSQSELKSNDQNYLIK